jgi:hypothetical protein
MEIPLPWVAFIALAVVLAIFLCPILRSLDDREDEE